MAHRILDYAPNGMLDAFDIELKTRGYTADPAQRMAAELNARLRYTAIDEILDAGLHPWLSDFIGRVEAQYPDTVDNEELNALLITIHNQEMEIKRLQTELKRVIGTNEEMLVEKSPKVKKEKN